MPTYDYQCDACGHAFDEMQSFKDEPLKVCPKDLCPQKKWGQGKVKRLMSAGAGLIFKGSGFYITDYRSENYKESAKKESAAANPSPTESKTTTSGAGDAKASKVEPKAPAKKSKPGSSE